jgi:hypothetical protein
MPDRRVFSFWGPEKNNIVLGVEAVLIGGRQAAGTR